MHESARAQTQRGGKNTQFAFSTLKVKNSVTAYIQAETLSLTASHTHTHTQSHNILQQF